MKHRYFIVTLFFVLGLLICSAAFYVTWNRLDPVNSCAQCHEVAPSHEMWQRSAHAEVNCIDCHGTAVSNGLHSLKEKGSMILTHFSKNKRNEDIRLSEQQVLEISERCASCHQSEHAAWLSGGHSSTYGNIFIDSVHNRSEKPYWDCLRCHGMFYDGSIHDLMSLEGSSEEWHLKESGRVQMRTIPCLACHQAHSENPLSGQYTNYTDSLNHSTKRPIRNPKTSLYVRADQMSLRSDRLTKTKMTEEGRPILLSDDPNTLLCTQCHAPNAQHEAGSGDDRTPTGVHEGISCIACHNPHSGDARDACDKCHPALSNCNLDVKKMNTSFAFPTSPNNIHRISCSSCHDDNRKGRTSMMK